MTNAQIILQEQIRLADEGILKVVGQMEVELPDGTTTMIPKIQTIHTYNAWKSRGFQVKKGEKAIAKFPVWKYTTKKKKDEDDEEVAEIGGRCYMRMSAFFTDEQVEPIKEGK